MAQRGFDDQMAALDALKGHELDAESIAFLRKMLGNRSNFLVAKAVRRVEENRLIDLLPELLAAYNRFFIDAVKTDPQCWAKNALSRALAAFECRDKDVFLRGLRHHQMEPTWGGPSDTAGTLRGNCALALVTCERLDTQQLLILLLDPLVDKDKSVRVEAVRALGQLGEPAVPLLRMRALLPGEEPEEMLAACFQVLLQIEGGEAVPFVARFLEAGDDSAAEAAFALAGIRSLPALDALLERQKNVADLWFNGALLSAIALTRLPVGIDFLLSKIMREERDAPLAIEALGRAEPNSELRARIVEAVEQTGSPRLKKALEEYLPSQDGSA